MSFKSKIIRYFALTVLALGITFGYSSAIHAASITNLTQWASVSGGNNDYFAATTSALTWTDANALAISLGGTLVIITNQSEQNFLDQTFLGSVGSAQANNAYWIGLNDIGSKGTYHWTSGAPVNYTNWNVGEPNNAHAGIQISTGEDYAALNWHYLNGYGLNTYGTWNDLGNNGCNNASCSNAQPLKAIIEFTHNPVATTPIPAAIWLVGSGLCVLFGFARRKSQF